MPIELWGSLYVFIIALVATRLRHPVLVIIFITCVHEYYVLPLNRYYMYYLCFVIGVGCAFFVAKFNASGLIGKILKSMYPLRELVAFYLFFNGYRLALDSNYTPEWILKWQALVII
jgi:hypothetical protein